MFIFKPEQREVRWNIYHLWAWPEAEEEAPGCDTFELSWSDCEISSTKRKVALTSLSYRPKSKVGRYITAKAVDHCLL